MVNKCMELDNYEEFIMIIMVIQSCNFTILLEVLHQLHNYSGFRVGLHQFCQQKFWKNRRLKAKSKILEKWLSESYNLAYFVLQR